MDEPEKNVENKEYIDKYGITDAIYKATNYRIKSNSPEMIDVVKLEKFLDIFAEKNKEISSKIETTESLYTLFSKKIRLSIIITICFSFLLLVCCILIIYSSYIKENNFNSKIEKLYSKLEKNDTIISSKNIENFAKSENGKKVLKIYNDGNLTELLLIYNKLSEDPKRWKQQNK